MSVVDLNQNAAVKNLHKIPFTLRHNLADHPLFELPRLVRLAQELPRDLVEYNSGNIEPGTDAESTPRLDMSPGDIVRNIEDNGAWMVLKKVEYDPEYKAILDEFVGDLFAAAGLAEMKFSDV